MFECEGNVLRKVARQRAKDWSSTKVVSSNKVLIHYQIR